MCRNKLLFTLLVLFCLVSCANEQSFEPTPTITFTPTLAIPTFTPSPAPATLTPTPAVLGPEEILVTVSSSMAFVSTPVQTGFGILIEGGYLLSNAQTTWPFETVMVTFFDGVVIADVPVHNLDLMHNLSLIGPIETTSSPIPFEHVENLAIDSELFLVSYASFTDISKPYVIQGQLVGLSDWEGMTYVISEMEQPGGNGGGVLVSNIGHLVGLTGFPSADPNGVLAISSDDIQEKLPVLIANEDISGLGEWRLPTVDEREGSTVILDHEWDQAVYVIKQPIETTIDLELSGGANVGFNLWDSLGTLALVADDPESLEQSKTAVTELDAPYFIQVFQHVAQHQILHLNSSHSFVPYTDLDDDESVSVNKTERGTIHFPGDYDYFHMFLPAGAIVSVQVESATIDPYLRIVPEGFPLDAMIHADDNTAGGIFGTASELTYYSPNINSYFLLVAASDPTDVGGYVIKVVPVYSGAPTPVSLPSTPTPVATEFGDMQEYEIPDYPFVLQYPVNWIQTTTFIEEGDLCSRITACFIGSEGVSLFVNIEDLNSLGVGDTTLEVYVDATIEFLGDNFTFLSREPFMTETRLPAEKLTLQSPNASFYYVRAITLHEGFALSVIYIIPSELYDTWEPIVDYMVRTLATR